MKPFKPKELVARVRTRLRSTAPAGQENLTIGDLTIDVAYPSERDFLPADVRRRQYVIGVVAEVFQSYGFEPLETPAFENIATLLGKYGDEGNQLIFKILRRGEHEATLGRVAPAHEDEGLSLIPISEPTRPY